MKDFRSLGGNHDGVDCVGVTPQARASQGTTVSTLAYRWMKNLWFT